jgi:hypothetical protein
LKAAEDGGEKDKNKIQNPDIAFIFNPQRDNFPSKAYYEDGNPELYYSFIMLKATLKKTGRKEKLSRMT